MEAQFAHRALAAVFVQVQQTTLHSRIRRRLAFVDHGLNAVPVEGTRQHEAAKACADDDDWPLHTSRSFSRERCSRGSWWSRWPAINRRAREGD